MGRYLKAVMVAALLVSALPLVAAAQPMMDCRLDYQEFTAPGLVGDATDEDIWIYCKNKGDATAGTVTVTVTAPTGTTAVWTAALGDYAVDASFQNRIDLAVDETVKPGSKLEVEVSVGYLNGVGGAAMDPTVETAVLKVLKMPEITVIGDHNGPAIFAPGGQVIYSRSSDDSMASWDIKTETESVLVLAGGTWTCNSHPALSPNGKKIALQRYNGVTFHAEIWVMNLDGTGLTLVAAATTFCWGWPLWVDNDTLLIRADDSAPEYASWWTVDIDGENLDQLSYEGFTYTPHADVSLIGGVPYAALQLNSDYIDVPVIQVYNLKTRTMLLNVPSILESNMGEFRPGSASLVYKDDWSNYGDLWITNLKGQKHPLTLRKAVKEYQVSIDADTIALDQNDILEVLSVVRADAPNGPTYDVVPFDFMYNDNTLELAEPLSATPGDRVPVLVTYLYAQAVEYDCYSKPHWAPGGDFLVYQFDFGGSIKDAWAMLPTGGGKIRLTFDDEMSSSDARNLPALSNGKLLISNSGTLELVDLAVNLSDRFGKDDDDDDDETCGAVPGPIPAWWMMLSLLVPLAAGFGIRRFARR